MEKEVGATNRRKRPTSPDFATALLTWFDRDQRPLPWRVARSPYRTWVAEVLLQQTRVAQAEGYFHRFVDRFPTVQSLAAAPEARVLKVWEGAGYYGRARRMRSAARALVREHGGDLPSDPAALEQLPGFGPYIARAVASVAFDVPVVPVDANIQRVGARLTNDAGLAGSSALRQRVTGWLTDRLPRGRPGAFAEALMELGETTCLPQRPRCDGCPVATFCRGHAERADPGVLPTRRPRRIVPHVRASIVALRDGRRWLVHRRSDDVLLGGLWEFPGGKIEPGETPRAAAERELLEETGLRAEDLRSFGVLRHVYSHFTVDLHLFTGVLSAVRRRPRPRRNFRWVSPSEFRQLPRPAATIRAAQRIGLATPSSPASPRTPAGRPEPRG